MGHLTCVRFTEDLEFDYLDAVQRFSKDKVYTIENTATDYITSTYPNTFEVIEEL